MTVMLCAAFLTAVTELALLLVLGEGRRRVLLSSVPMNLLTNLLLNAALRAVSLPQEGYTLLAVLLEAAVFCAEGGAYAWLTRDGCRAVLYTLLCNTASLAVGGMVFLVSNLL